MKSLLDKAKSIPYKKIYSLKTKEEQEIALIILNLPTIICEYLYNLTSIYNKFYAENKIITEKEPKLQESRLVLTKVIYEVNNLLLDVLGIKVPKKM